jgi:hypothetical protein
MVLWSKRKQLSRHKAVALRFTIYSTTACALPTGAPLKRPRRQTQQDEGNQAKSQTLCVRGGFNNRLEILQSEVRVTGFFYLTMRKL